MGNCLHPLGIFTLTLISSGNHGDGLAADGSWKPFDQRPYFRQPPRAQVLERRPVWSFQAAQRGSAQGVALVEGCGL